MMGPASCRYLPLGLAPALSPERPRGGLGVYLSALGQRPAQHQHGVFPNQPGWVPFCIAVLPNGNILGWWFLIGASH